MAYLWMYPQAWSKPGGLSRVPADSVLKFFERAASKIRLGSALNPCVWLCAILTPGCIALSLLFAGTAQLVILGISSLPVLYFGWTNWHFAKHDPDKLRTEEFELRRTALKLIEEKGSAIPVNIASIEAITNSKVKALKNEQLK